MVTVRFLCQFLPQKIPIWTWYHVPRRFWSCVVIDKTICQENTGSSEDQSKSWIKTRKKKQHSLPPKPANDHLPWEERLTDAVTPLWRLSYEEQLQLKFEEQKRILLQLSARLSGDADPLNPQPRTRGQLSFPLLPTLPSPVLGGYRNKSTFSVNRGIDGDPKTVGFYVGTGKGRNIVCVRSDHLLNMPEKHKEVARFYEEFIRQSPLEPCILFHEGGHWREITVRTNAVGSTMAIVYFHPQNLTEEEIQPHKETLVEFFTHGPGAACQLTSLYFQESSMTRCTNEQSPYQLLYGEPYIFEELLGLRFRISADAFFQVNTSGAEVLYRTVGELSKADRSSILIDVCCGTGAIGLSLSKGVEQVIGIELIEQAVQDAAHNASLNGISNCDFRWEGRSSFAPVTALAGFCSPPFAIVNPSRAGLHYRVTRAIRNCTSIRRLIYISCKPDGEAMRNFAELCCPPDRQKKLLGDPFVPAVAIPVDMFPHTAHCELVLVFER